MVKQNQATVNRLALGAKACLLLYVHEYGSRQMSALLTAGSAGILPAGCGVMNDEADKMSALPALTAQSRASFVSNVAKNAADSSSGPARPLV